MYETPTWRQTVSSVWGTVFQLPGAHRHAGDLEILQILPRIRLGEQRDADIALLNATSAGLSNSEWDQPTQVRATNVAVDVLHDARMALLPTPAVVFPARDTVLFTHPERQRYELKELTVMVASLKEFKVGAAVISTLRVDSIPPGKQGKAISVGAGMYVQCVFGGGVVQMRPQAFFVVDNSGEKLDSRTQIPLVLGLALTMQRCQGMTLDSLAIDISKQMWRKQSLVYSGLSRCCTLRGKFREGVAARAYCCQCPSDALLCFSSLSYLFFSVRATTFKSAT